LRSKATSWEGRQPRVYKDLRRRAWPSGEGAHDSLSRHAYHSAIVIPGDKTSVTSNPVQITRDGSASCCPSTDLNSERVRLVDTCVRSQYVQLSFAFQQRCHAFVGIQLSLELFGPWSILHALGDESGMHDSIISFRCCSVSAQPKMSLSLTHSMIIVLCPLSDKIHRSLI
jgi:hypothetical protein